MHFSWKPFKRNLRLPSCDFWAPVPNGGNSVTVRVLNKIGLNIASHFLPLFWVLPYAAWSSFPTDSHSFVVSLWCGRRAAVYLLGKDLYFCLFACDVLQMLILAIPTLPCTGPRVTEWSRWNNLFLNLRSIVVTATQLMYALFVQCDNIVRSVSEKFRFCVVVVAAQPGL